MPEVGNYPYRMGVVAPRVSDPGSQPPIAIIVRDSLVSEGDHFEAEIGRQEILHFQLALAGRLIILFEAGINHCSQFF